MSQLRFVIAQLNFSVGDIQGNLEKILSYTKKAQEQYQPDMVIFPELALSGYPPEDLLLRSDFHQQIQNALNILKKEVKGVDILVGYPKKQGDILYNAACVIRDGQILADYHKQKLPNYGVFDEKRYFKPGTETCVFPYKGVPLGLIICEDVWYQEPAFQAHLQGAKLLLCINASPFDSKKLESRGHILKQRTQENHIPIIYAHFVGGQDELLFDGRSMVIDGDSHFTHQAPPFEEILLPVDITYENREVKVLPGQVCQNYEGDTLLYKALVKSIEDYVDKNRFKGVLVGVSGGIDSALTLTLAVDALGAEKVTAVIMPSRYTSEKSLDDAKALIHNLGVKFYTLPIEPAFSVFIDTLKPVFHDKPEDVTEENLQARIRGTLLMSLSNKLGLLVLTTGNKSEMAVGYATLYGDMAGGFAVLKDIYKTEVYRIANYRNSIKPVIPLSIIEREPTAELRFNQKDQDTLPPYPELDAILKLYVEQDKTLEEIVAQGHNRELVLQILRWVDKNEYKRRQAPPGPRMSTRAFGRDRRYPVTSGFQVDDMC